MTRKPRSRPNATDELERETYHSRAAGTRNLAGDEARPGIVGAGCGYPRIPSGPWGASSEPNLPEPPLGYCINELPEPEPETALPQAPLADDVEPIAPSSASFPERNRR